MMSFIGSFFFLSFMKTFSCSNYVKMMCYIFAVSILVSQEAYIPNVTSVVFDSLGFGVLDEYKNMLMMMLMLVVFFSYICYKIKNVKDGLKDSLSLLLFVGLVVASMLVFSSSSLFWIYFGYEMSLIPIIFIIMVWGSYPERMYSSMVMLLYTIFFSFPLMVVLLYFYMKGGSFSNVLLFENSPILGLMSLIVFCSFAVKLPVYGLHYWLPLAHVEAPTFGSMLLAGILLKLGGCAMYRFLSMNSFLSLDMVYMFFSLLLVGMLVSSVASCVQSDMKRLVAYSSVVHMTSVGCTLILSMFMGYKSVLIIMFMHGISSPLLFFTVGELYELFGTRSMVFMRGLYFLVPMVFMSMVMSFFLGVPVPPVLGFLGEVVMFTTLVSFSLKVMVVAFIYVFLGVVFNLYWLSSSFGSPVLGVNTSVSMGSNWIMIYMPILGFFVLMLSGLFYENE